MPQNDAIVLKATLSPEARASAVNAVVNMAMEVMTETFFADDGEDMGMMADQLVKGLLTTGAMLGFFKNPHLGAIYRNSSLTPVQKGMDIAEAFCKEAVKSPEFHEKFGAMFDEKLMALLLELHKAINLSGGVEVLG